MDDYIQVSTLNSMDNTADQMKQETTQQNVPQPQVVQPECHK